jgi:hypothetical protein
MSATVMAAGLPATAGASVTAAGASVAAAGASVAAGWAGASVAAGAAGGAVGGAGMGVACPQAVTMETITMREKIVSNNLLGFIFFILLFYEFSFSIKSSVKQVNETKGKYTLFCNLLSQNPRSLGETVGMNCQRSTSLLDASSR